MTISPRNRDFIAGFQSGTYTSVKQLCEWHYAPLMEFAQQLTLNNWVAHAILLDAFVKLIQMRDQFDNETNIKAFLYVTVRNRCHAWMQSGEERAADDFKPGNGQDPEALLQDLHALPEKQRKVFECLYAHRLKTPQVAEQLEMDIRLVGQLREKALRQLSENHATPLMIHYLSVVSPA